jgi:putative endonuclease
MSNWYLYIVECIDGTGAKYTRGRGPVVLKYFIELENKSEAAKMEYRIKKLTRKQKLELIDGFKG